MKTNTASVLLSVMAGVLLAASPVFAQSTTAAESEERFVHSVGAGAGFTTGYGLSYRYTPGKLGVQVNFAPYFDAETKRYSVGITPMYKLIENNNSNLYLYQGNHYYYNSELTWVYDPNLPPTQERERVTESYMNNGVGIGFEFIILKRIGFNLMGGYASYKNFEQLSITGETALYYKF